MVDIGFKGLERAPEGERPTTMKHGCSSGIKTSLCFPSPAMLKPNLSKEERGSKKQQASKKKATKKGEASCSGLGLRESSFGETVRGGFCPVALVPMVL